MAAILAVILPLVYLTASLERASYFERELAMLRGGLQKERAHAYDSARTIGSRIFGESAILRKDAGEAEAILERERVLHDLDLLSVADANGIAIQNIPQNRGLYLFQTTEFGAKMSGGISVSAFDKGAIFPLVVIGAYPVFENGLVSGGVTAGSVIDDAYASRFRDAYADSKTEIAFYSIQQGVVSTSFDDPDTKQTILETFGSGNTGSELFKKFSLDSNYFVRIKGVDYAIFNITLQGIKQSPGGVLIFIPYRYHLEQTAAGAIALIFLAIALLYIFHRHKHEPLSCFIAIVFCAAVFLGIITLGQKIAQLNNTEIRTRETAIYNSTLELQPSSGIFDKNFEQAVIIKIYSGGEAINAAQAELYFNPAQMEITSIDTSNSLCLQNLFVEKKFDNEAGKISIVCGVPSPGFKNTSGEIARFTFHPKQTGEMEIAFGPETKVLANDGLGTDVLRMSTGASYFAAPEISEDDSESPGRALVFSRSHPNQLRWYSRRTINFSIKGTENSESILYSFDMSPTGTPTEAAESGEVNIQTLADGIYYLHARLVMGKAAGPITHYRVQIDSTPPQSFNLRASGTNIQTGGVVRLEFVGSDYESGFQPNQYIRIGNGIFLPVRSPVYIPFTQPGSYLITIRGFDMAGNIRDENLGINVSSPQSWSQALRETVKTLGW